MKGQEYLGVVFDRIAARSKSGEPRDVFICRSTHEIVDHPHEGTASRRYSSPNYETRFFHMGTYSGRMKLKDFISDYEYCVEKIQKGDFQ